MKKILLVIILLASALITFYFAHLTYSSVNPLGAVKLDYNSYQIEEKADSLMHKMGINEKTKSVVTSLQMNNNLTTALYKELPFSQVNMLLREKIPGYYWEIDWGKQESSIVIQNGENKSNETTGITLNYDTRGNLLKFDRPLDDSLKLGAISQEKAESLAVRFISDYAPIKIEDSSFSADGFNISGSFRNGGVQKTEKLNRTDYRFNWEAESAVINKKLALTVVISGELISEYNLSFEIPESAGKHSDTFEIITEIPFYIIVFILMLIIGFRKIRAYEISFRLAIIMGVIVGILFSINLYTMISDSAAGWELWLPLIFSAVFFAAGVIITWSVSETVARETWKEKFISLDLLTKGYVFHSRVGNAGITGITGGFIFYLIWLILLYISESLFHIWFVVKDNSSLISHFYSISPALSILDKSIYPQIFTASIFLLFVFSGLKRRFNSLIILIPITAIIWGLVGYNNMYPLYCGVITGIIISAVFLIFFSTFDLLSAIISLSVYHILDLGISLFTSGNSWYWNSGYYLIAVFIILFILLLIALFTKDKITDFDSITPAFVKNITERQRLQRELEIARDVQMSFLPAKDPEFCGLEIAARCIPAREVGGDYYDFVKLGDSKFGVIIGDVSGKGTQAAFYMILVKGFVRALSKTEVSPAEFLIKINELFYENVERGTFISMIYGIFDIKEHSFVFARAGHNPVIAKHSGKNEIDLLNPVGLALGLEKGNIFNKTIKETKVDIHPGDTFVFYTDGFTEAMNKFKLEYTQERLAQTISDFINLPVKELLEKSVSNVNAFIGKAVQHDDMTMVVVRVVKK